MSRKNCIHWNRMIPAKNRGGMTTRRRTLWVLLLVLAAYLAMPCPAAATMWYGTTYSGISVGSNGTTYGWGVTDVWYTDSYHTAQITTWLYSPGWRRAVSGGGIAFNFIRADVSVPWDPGDLGTYCVSSTHSGNCPFMGSLGTANTYACTQVQQVPTKLSLVSTISQGPATCSPGSAGWDRWVRWQVMDQFVPAHPIQRVM